MNALTCPASVNIDFDPLFCRLEAGHHGFHELQGDGPAVLWVEKHVGSTGYVSPRETWPDDTEADAAIAKADDLIDALFEIASKYDIPVTNNLPRWQEGRFLRGIGDFIGDVKSAVTRFPMSEPTNTVSNHG